MRKDYGSLPVIECEEVRNWTWETEGSRRLVAPRKVATWVYHCDYCHCIHSHKAGEGHRGTVCPKPERKYGYYIRLAHSDNP